VGGLRVVLPGVGDGQPPAPAEAMAAFRAVRGWVDGWSVEGGEGGEGVAVVGASVVLRWGTSTVGSATRVLGPGSRASGTLLAEVTQAAMAQAAGRLPGGGGGGDRARLALQAPELMVSVEVAGAVTPIVPLPALATDLARLLEPGIDGLYGQAKGAGEAAAAISPAGMLRAGQSVPVAYTALAVRLSGQAAMGLEEPVALGEKIGLELGKFRTTQVVQLAAGSEPVFLTRGRRVVEMADVDSGAELATVAMQMQGHVLRRMGGGGAGGGGGQAGFGGLYNPAAGVFEAGGLGVGDVALVVLAMHGGPGRWAAAAQEQGPALAAAEAALARAVEGVGGAGLGTSDAALAVVAAGCMAERPAWAEGLRAQVREAVRRVLPAEGAGGKGGAGGKSEAREEAAGAARPGERALWALALLSGEGDGAEDAELGRRLVRAVFAQTPAGALAWEMPWLLWAEQRAAAGVGGVGGVAAEGGVKALPAASALREMRAALVMRQMAAGEPGVWPDTVGAMPLGMDPTGVRAGADWNTARLVATLAWMWADDRLTGPGAERGTQLVATLRGVRFVRQLMEDESTAWMCAEPAVARGAVRLALAEVRSGVQSTATGLLSVNALRRALGERAGGERK
jgi:hypothetical protein